MSGSGQDNLRGPGGPNPGGIPPELVDQFFDGEMEEHARRAFLRALPTDLDRCEEVAKTRRMLDLLRQSAPGGDSAAPAPDLTGRIIAAVDSRRGFASHRVRRLARVARLGLAAALVLVVGAVAAVERVAPDATRLAPAPAPLTSALRESQAEMASTLGSLATTIESIQVRVGHGVDHAMYLHRVERHGQGAQVDAPAKGEHEVLHRVSFGAPQPPQPPEPPSPPVARGDEQIVVVRMPQAPAHPRVMGVSLSLSSKSPPRAMTWSLDMAPRGVARSRPVRLIDADGRSSALISPLGIERGEFGAQGPYVLPGREAGTVGARSGATAPVWRGPVGP